MGDPFTYGNPLNAYSVTSNPLMNANGITVAIDSAGVYGHFGTESVNFAQRNADGTWGPLSNAWIGTIQYGGGPNVGGVTIAGINNLNQIIGTMTGTSNLSNAVLYDIGSHTLTNLSTLPALAGFLNIEPVAIDDLGRILVEASPAPGSAVQTEQTLLLTPSGVPGNPIPAPEPGSFAVMALAVAAFAVRHVREHRRRG